MWCGSYVPRTRRRRARRRSDDCHSLQDLGDDAGADGLAALADGEAHLLFESDGGVSATVILMLSPGITILTPSGSSTEPVTSVVRM